MGLTTTGEKSARNCNSDVKASKIVKSRHRAVFPNFAACTELLRGLLGLGTTSRRRSKTIAFHSAVPDLLSIAKSLNEGFSAGYINNRAPTRFSAISGLSFTNVGATFAVPVYLVVGWQVTEKLQPIPLYRKGMALSPSRKIHPGEVLSVEQRYNIELTEAELAATANGTQWLWVYGVLRYRDPCHTEGSP